MKQLKNKVIVIGGGKGLIGSAFVKACEKEGANVVIADLPECNLTHYDDVAVFVYRTLQKYGKIDALVNCAYPRNKNYNKKPFEKTDIIDFKENIDLHLSAYFLITQTVSKYMIKRKKGTIINISSIYGFNAPRFEVYKGTKMGIPIEYAIVKGGIINMTKYLASYLGKYNINVNCISPGGVFDNQPSSFVKEYTKRVSMGKRMASVDDLTSTLIYLLSDKTKYVTGQNICVDGGWSL